MSKYHKYKIMIATHGQIMKLNTKKKVVEMYLVKIEIMLLIIQGRMVKAHIVQNKLMANNRMVLIQNGFGA